MSTIPLVINFQNDYGMKVFQVDAGLTIAELIKHVSDQLIDVVVKPFPPNTILVARRHGSDAALPENMRLSEAGFVRMETLDICVP